MKNVLFSLLILFVSFSSCFAQNETQTTNNPDTILSHEDLNKYVGKLITIMGQVSNTKIPTIIGVDVSSDKPDLRGEMAIATGILEKWIVSENEVDILSANRGAGTFYRLKVPNSNYESQVLKAKGILLKNITYCPKALFIKENTYPKMYYSFSSNDTLLICGDIYSIETDKFSGLFAIFDSKKKKEFKYYTEVNLLSSKFSNDTFKITIFSVFLNLKTDSFEIAPYEEDIVTISNGHGLMFKENIIFSYPKISIENQNKIIKEHWEIMRSKEKEDDEFDTYSLIFLKNIYKLFYCALNGNKEAEKIFLNFDEIVFRYKKEFFYGGMAAESYNELLRIYRLK